MRKISLLFIVAVFVITTQQPTFAQSRALDSTIAKYAKKHNFSGTIIIQNQSKRIYFNSFGVADRSFNVPVTTDTKFRIASITKTFTAALILQLYEQGEIDLNAPIKTYLPGYTGEGAGRVRVHNLLNHTSGIENFDSVKTYEEAVTKGIEYYQLPRSTDELLNKYSSGKIVNEVGKVFDYNNADYIILGKIIEKIEGKSFEQVLKERILIPLGMKESGMLYQQDIVTNLAKNYFKPGEGKSLINDMPFYFQNWYAAGGMYSTADDLLKFSNALFGKGLLKPASLALMLKPGLDNYGYGLWARSPEIHGKKFVEVHRPGSIAGANCSLLHYPEKRLTVIILSNTNLTDIDGFSFMIGEELIK